MVVIWHRGHASCDELIWGCVFRAGYDVSFQLHSTWKHSWDEDAWGSGSASVGQLLEARGLDNTSQRKEIRFHTSAGTDDGVAVRVSGRRQGEGRGWAPAPPRCRLEEGGSSSASPAPLWAATEDGEAVVWR